MTTSAERRLAIYQRARRWIDAVREPEQQGYLLDQFWREYLADAEVWDYLDLAQRRDSLDSIRRDLERTVDLRECLVGDGRLFALALKACDFADAWSLLGDAGGRRRDGRSALAWWRHIVPETLEDRVNPTRDTSFVAHIWPAPQPKTLDSKGWREVLAQHFLALNALNAKQRRVSGALIPDPLRYAWNRAQPCLELSDCLDLVYLLACDPKAPPGLRWSLEDPRPWVESLQGKLLSDLQAVIAGPDPAVETTPGHGMALMLVAVLRGWRPYNPAKLVEGSDPEIVAELFHTLSDQGAAPAWMDSLT